MAMEPPINIGWIVDAFERFETLARLFKLFKEDPEAIMLMVSLGIGIGWLARQFCRENKRKSWAFVGGVLVVFVSAILISRWLSVPLDIRVEAHPRSPWLQGPVDRPEDKNYAILPEIMSDVTLTDVRLTLVQIYKFSNGQWGSPFDLTPNVHPVFARVAW